MHFRVATLNTWLLPYPWPIGSRDRKYRLQKLAEELAESDFDAVALQEIWSENDFRYLTSVLESKFPYFHYFHSGFTGSGTCVFSAHRIRSTLLHRYSLNGFAHHVHRGDWFGGKIVGMVELEVNGVLIALYTTHLHAEYNRDNDLYLPHRLSQAFELGQFVRHTGASADFIIVTGDFNIEPEDLGYQIIRNIGNLNDAWEDRPNTGDGWSGMTCDRPDNCYTIAYGGANAKEGKRIDYIMYQSGRCKGELVECTNCLDRIPGPKKLNYSDHLGIRAVFNIINGGETTKDKSDTVLVPRSFLQKSINILEEGEIRVLWDRRLFIAMLILGLMSLVVSMNVQSVYPSSSVVPNKLMLSHHLLRGLVRRCVLATPRFTSSNVPEAPQPEELSNDEIWRRRRQLSAYKMQRFEKPQAKIYYAPEWDFTKAENQDEKYNPRGQASLNPRKWEFQNKVVWPPNHIVPETSLPKPVEVFHCEEAIHSSVKKLFPVSQFVCGMKLDEAILQLKFKQTKVCTIVMMALNNAKKRAAEEFQINDTSNMFVAEAFPIQYMILKSQRRHARERWCKTRHRYVHYFIRLEEGSPPPYKGREPMPNGWEKMEKYYKYLRSREIKYSI